MLAHYTFDQGSGTTLADSSGNGNDLTLGSGTNWQVTGVFGGSYDFGTESALSRTGGASSGTLANLNTVTGNQVTISFWAQSASESIRSNPFYFGTSAAGQGSRIFASHLEWSDGQTYWDVAWDVNNGNRVNGDLGLSADQMHHYVMTFDGDLGEMFVYKDNVEVLASTSVPGGTINWANLSNFEIGAFSFDSFWDGQVDDFAIWNEVIDENSRTIAFTQGVGAIPEPASGTLFLTVAAGFLLRRRR